MNLFGTDGIRGVANSELTWKTAFGLGRAIGLYLTPHKDIAVGKDTRASGDMLEAALVAGLTSSGRNAVRLGVITTPGLSYIVKRANLGGGVMISASHNPSEYNGLKVFGPDGTKLPDETEELLSALILQNPDGGPCPTGRAIGRVISGEGLVEDYVDFLVGVPGRSLAGMRVAVDAAHGSTSDIAARVWDRVGARVQMICNAPDGHNINDGCGSTHIESLTGLVKRLSVDAGFAYDGDGDRCIATDECGEEMNGDHMMALLADSMASRGTLKGNVVVGTVMSNFGLEAFLTDRKIRLVRTPVGDRFVLEAMRQGGYSLGGEQSGHIIFRDILETGDGILTSLMVAGVAAESRSAMSGLRSIMTNLPQTLVNVKKANPKAVVASEAVTSAVAKAQADLAGSGRVLVRASGTEPLVRIMVESEDSAKVASCIQYLEEVIEKERETEPST